MRSASAGQQLTSDVANERSQIHPQSSRGFYFAARFCLRCRRFRRCCRVAFARCATLPGPLLKLCTRVCVCVCVFGCVFASAQAHFAVAPCLRAAKLCNCDTNLLRIDFIEGRVRESRYALPPPPPTCRRAHKANCARLNINERARSALLIGRAATNDEPSRPERVYLLGPG